MNHVHTQSHRASRRPGEEDGSPTVAGPAARSRPTTRECPQCRQSVPYSQYARHLRARHGVDEWKWKHVCPECARVFPRCHQVRIGKLAAHVHAARPRCGTGECSALNVHVRRWRRARPAFAHCGAHAPRHGVRRRRVHIAHRRTSYTLLTGARRAQDRKQRIACGALWSGTRVEKESDT